MEREEAIKIVKSHYPANKQMLNEALEFLIPELKESGEERIRKALVRFHKSTIDVDGIKGEDILAWLEKQKSVGEIVERCKNSWYNEGKIAGQFEGITDDEKYQQGWHDALEKQGNNNNQNWKPSKEQYEALDYAYNSCSDTERGNYYEGVLETLIEDLHRLEKQGEQKFDNIEDIVEIFVHDEKAYTNPAAFENSLGRLLKLFEKLPKQDLLDGLKFYANVVEHDGKYVKSSTWSEEDEKIITALKEGFRYHQLFNPTFGKVPNAEIIDWLKSLKERLS